MYIKNKNKRIDIRIDEKLHNFLQEEAKIRNCTVSELARSIILDYYLAKMESLTWIENL